MNMPKKRISVQSAKAKGRRLQQWAAQKISDLIGYAWGADEMIASREMGQAGTDIRLIGDAKKDFPWSVECKAVEQFSMPSWIKQAEENRLPGTDWLLITKQSRKSQLVTLEAKVFFDLLKLIPYKKKGR